MKNLRRVYLSLGSNIGDRVAYLKEAVKKLEALIAPIVVSSPIYKTEAWGFNGDFFLNVCVAIDTHLQPQELLKIILQIEQNLGRVRDKQFGYTSRTIDIDVLFYENEVINTPELKIPHPEITNRIFVLKPLADIAPNTIHPTAKKTIKQLLDACNDNSLIETTHYNLKDTQTISFTDINFIAIEGNIGAGKTTLATKIANDFNGKLILEQFADNPFLPKFYEDQQRYAFPLEMSFLAERYQQFTDDTTQPDLFNSFLVSDYDIFKSLIFAKVTLPNEEFKLYRKLFNFMYKEVIKPDVYVYLYQSTERLLENIKKRGRSYEQHIPADYLNAINKSYFEYIKSYKELNALVIDITEMDFVKNESDYRYIINKILDFHSKKKE